LFVVKHKPKNLDEYVDQKDALDQFLKWIERWRHGKALLFHGPPGTGKTALVEAYCQEKGLDLIQLNASDYRSAAQIKEVLGSSVQQSSLFKRGKIFMIDEIDGLAGREDKGGVREIISIIKKSSYPVILTANDPWNKRLRSLRQYCQLVQFKKIPVWDI
jgi:replication factor C large subunit